MGDIVKISNIFGWLFGTAVLVAGILNMVLVHAVPGIVYLMLSTIYFPPSSAVLTKTIGFSLPVILKVILAIIIFIFTLGVSDLGDLID